MDNDRLAELERLWHEGTGLPRCADQKAAVTELLAAFPALIAEVKRLRELVEADEFGARGFP